VTLGGYCIDKTEVTVAAYAHCVVATGKCKAVLQTAPIGLASLCNGTRADRQDHPVNCVRWDQANAYCESVNKRLPTEAEWEYTARGGDGRTYPWGNEAPSAKRLNACGIECRALGNRLKANWPVMYYDNDAWEATAPVGSFPLGASPFGALDMAGNVAEWTADWWGVYEPGSSTNPTRPKNGIGGFARVIRGGAWGVGAAPGVRGAARSATNPTGWLVNLGFRCARGD
jgi:formylglycine-generating enzyme required for sulfatase activity